MALLFKKYFIRDLNDSNDSTPLKEDQVFVDAAGGDVKLKKKGAK